MVLQKIYQYLGTLGHAIVTLFRLVALKGDALQLLNLNSLLLLSQKVKAHTSKHNFSQSHHIQETKLLHNGNLKMIAWKDLYLDGCNKTQPRREEKKTLDQH